MAVSSLLPGRVPQSLSASRLIKNVQVSQSALARLEQQIGTGERFVLPSEAPADALRTISLQRLREQGRHFQSNVAINNRFLATSEQALSSASEALNRALGIVQTGIGSGATTAEKQALADEVQSLIKGTLNAANTRHNGRSVFAGSHGDADAFTVSSTGLIRYNGDRQSLQTIANQGLLVASNLDGVGAFGELANIESGDLNAALTLPTPLNQLNGGRGLTPGVIGVTVDNGTPISKEIDLAGAETLQDVKTRIEAAFAAESITVTVDIDPASQSGLRLTPSAGTIAIADRNGGTSAKSLGITSTPVAQVLGQNLDPLLTADTTLATLNGGTGIGATVGTGLRLVHNGATTVIDLNGLTTVGDLTRSIEQIDPDLIAEISDDGRGLVITSRLSGTTLSIGENGGTNATALGLRSLAATTRLSELNRGIGIPQESTQPLVINRRSGTAVEVNLSAAQTVQDVLTAINAVDPGVLTATLNSTGNGITIADSAGPGTLTINETELSRRLGVAGTSSTGTIIGTDVNPQTSEGVFGLLISLDQALRAGNDAELTRLRPLLENEGERVGVARSELGSRQQLLLRVEDQLGATELSIEEQIEQIFGVDVAEAITQLTQQQQTLEATLQISAQTLQISLLNYL